MLKFYLRRKSDGHVIVYEDTRKLRKLKDEMIARGDFELMTTVDSPHPEQKAYKEVPIVDDTLECPLCGKVFSDETKLKEHKSDHK